MNIGAITLQHVWNELNYTSERMSCDQGGTHRTFVDKALKLNILWVFSYINHIRKHNTFE